MAKQINVDLRVNADVNQAKRAMKELQDSLSNLTKTETFGKGFGANFNKEVQQAQKEIATLKISLENAFNVDTGRLDFGKFNQQLQQSGHSLQTYAATLNSLGPQGTQAFLQLTRAVASSEVPVIRLSDRVKELGTSLANTMRWQFSSSVLHGLMGGLQSAYRYAQDLNRSLNDIRIVTGQSSEQMAEFAERANKAAQALSATTKEYTDASLIFYQQGLDDAEVASRTDTTIKMAHAAGESAKEVSSYMTAIWNNFAQAGDNLEYYADVITKLGAATAASSAEIAGGLEKFAAVADTVGLSYEYAAAAVTTIVDKTRQSEDIVGTSLKTILARMEGLQQGKTEEDGTDLNKYSKALLTVGVNIKDVNGELKSMDTIIDELGARWKTLADDQKIALAQTVGGMRQYNQFIALMDNYDDLMLNVQRARTSEGTLTEQQNIYAESWEAARDRVRAAAEDIYDSLIDDKFFIKLTDGFAEFLKILDKMIENMGGLKGVLLQIAPIITSIFNEQITQSMREAAYTIGMIVPGGRQKAINERDAQANKMLAEAKNKLASKGGENSLEYKQLEDEMAYRKAIEERGKTMSSFQKSVLELEHKINQARLEDLNVLKQQTEELKDQSSIKNREEKHYVKKNFSENVLPQFTTTKSEVANVYGFQEFFRDNTIADSAKSAALETAFKDFGDTKKLGEYLNVDGFFNIEELQGEYKKQKGILEKSSSTAEQRAEAEKKILEIYGDIKKKLEEYRDTIIDNIVNKAVEDIGSVNTPKRKFEDETTDYSLTDKEIKNKILETGTYSEKAFDIEFGDSITREKLIAAKQFDESYLEGLKEEQKAGKENAKEIKKYTNAIKVINGILDTLDDDERRHKEEIVKYNENIDQQNIELGQIASGEGAMAEGSAKVSEIRFREQNEDVPKPEEAYSDAYEARSLDVSSAIMGIGQAAMTASGMVSTLNSTLDVLFDDEASAAQKFGAVIQGLISMVTQLGFLMNNQSVSLFLESKAKDANTIAEIANKKARQETNKEINKQTKNLEENATAENLEGNSKSSGSLLKKGPDVGAAGGFAVLAVAIIAIMTVVKKWQQMNDEFQASIDENKNKIEENISAIQEESSALSNNIRIYDEANNKWKNGNSTKQEYCKTLAEVAKNLGVENAEILEQIGAYNALEKAIKDAQKEKYKEALGTRADIQNELDQSVYYYSKQNMGVFRTEFGGSESIGGVSSTVGELLKEVAGINLEAETDNFGNIAGYQVSIDFSTFDYASFGEAMAKAEKLAQDDESFYNTGTQLTDLYKILGLDDEGFRNRLRESNKAALSAIAAEDVFNLGETLASKDIDEVYNLVNARLGQLSKDNRLETLGANVEDLEDEYFNQLSAISSSKNVKILSLLRDYADSSEYMDMDVMLNKYKQYEGEGKGEQFLNALGSIDLTKITGTDIETVIEKFNHTVASIDVDGLSVAVEDAKKAFKDYTVGTKITEAEEIARVQAQEGWQENFAVTKQDIEGNATELMMVNAFDANYINAANVMTAEQLIEARKQAEEDLDYWKAEQERPKVVPIASNDPAYQYMPEWAKQQSKIDAMMSPEEQISDLEAGINDIDNAISTLDTEALIQIEESLGGYYEKNKQIAALNTAEEWKLNQEEVSKYARNLEELNPELKENIGEAEELAVSAMLLDEGFKNLISSFDNWYELLSDGNQGTIEESEALSDLEKTFQKIFNTTDKIPDDFLLDNLENIRAFVDGNENALDQMMLDYAKMQAMADESYQSYAEDWENLFNLSKDLPIGDLHVGAYLDNQQFIDACNEMMASGKVSADAIKAYLEGIDWEGTFETYQDGEDIKFKLTSAKSKGSLGSYLSSSKKSGGGGGGGSRSKKDLKDFDDEIERYYTINRQIKDQQDELDRLAKAKDRAFGASKLAYIDAESAALAKQIDLQKEKIKQVTDYYKLDMSKLNAFGAIYDENGVLTNYDEIAKAQLDAYNDAVNKYNAGGSEADFDIATQRYEYFKEVLKQYDDTNQLFQEEMDNLRDLEYEYYDKRLEKIQTTIELNIDVKDDKLDLLEYRLKRIQDQSFSAAKALSEMADELDINMSKQQDYENGIAEILAGHGFTVGDLSSLTDEQLKTAGFTQDEVDTLRDYNKAALDLQGTMDDLESEILDGVLNVTKEWNDEFERTEKIASHFDKVIASYKNISDLTRGTTGVSGQFLLGLQRQSLESADGLLSISATEVKANKVALDAAQKALENAQTSGADKNTIDRLKRNLNEIEEIYNSSVEKMNSNLESALKKAQELLKATIDEYKKQMAEAINVSDFDNTVFDHMKKIDDFYLDDYEKIYEFSKLTRDINKSLDKESSAANMERYREVLDEIQELEESGVEITQYQVDALRKKYELAQAYANLEDSQNAKNTVRMSRDASGNMSYVYTAKENDDALQDYEDRLYEYQKLNSDYIKQQEEAFRNLKIEALEAFAAIYNDPNSTEAEKEKRMQEAVEYYNKMAAAMGQELDLALGYNKELYNGYWKWYSDKYDYAISKQQDYQSEFEYTMLGKLEEVFPDAESLTSDFIFKMTGEEGYISQLSGAWEQYTKDQSISLGLAGIEVDRFADHIKTKADEAGKEVDTQAELIKAKSIDMYGSLKEAFDKINDIVGIDLSKPRDEFLGMAGALGQMIERLTQIPDAIKTAQTSIEESAPAFENFTANVSSSGSSGGPYGDTSYATVKDTSTGMEKPSNWNSVSFALGGFNLYKSYLEGRYKAGYLNKGMYNSLIGNTAKETLDKIRNGGKMLQSILTSDDIWPAIRSMFQGFDTGGYTGAWNSSDGRLALLHQKELVLNAKDTENMLAMVDIARGVIQSISGRDMINNRLSEINSNMNNINTSNNETLQNVQINATFTDATTREEITAAFDTLINRASQYIGHKKY